MGAPAIVLGDQITGQCPIHIIPNPATGIPQPSPPLPFSAPITIGVCPTVMIEGKPAAVVGCTGYNTPPHVGLFPADPFMVPTMQMGTVLSGSMTVLFGGQPAATAMSSSTCCATPGTITPTVTSVLIG
jgi:uncharacterized Zn-binding protein involved in type VI secretion